jgi:uncharacterized protein (TIGR03435 family)
MAQSCLELEIRTAALVILAASGMFAQSPPARPTFDSFEVATIKPADPNARGRTVRMQSAHQLFARNFTLKELVGVAYSLTPRAISGGPAWVESDRYDVVAGTPGEVRPNLDEQMQMLRKLLTDRFSLGFHREPKEFSIYALTVAKNGPKLRESSAPPDGLPDLVNVVYPEEGGGVRIVLPARNATMAQFAAMMNRAVLDRPVVDQTGITGKYDFDLEWTPDETQFGGQLPQGVPEHPKPDLFAALQQQLGLRLEATKGPIEALVIDKVGRPSEN